MPIDTDAAANEIRKHLELAGKLERILLDERTSVPEAMISIAILTVVGLRHMIAQGMDEKAARDEYTKLLTGVYAHLPKPEEAPHAH